jgi:hypothetical protein
MNANDLAREVSAPIAIVAGLLVCFCGYRILKLTLGIMGFLTGAAAGWSFGLSFFPNHDAVALICAIIVGLIGAGLCVWLYFFGIFLLGAGAGAIVAMALFDAAGNQIQPLLVLVCAVVFGIIALVMQKLMIIASTAFSGSYLIVAGCMRLLTGAHNGLLLWFDRLQPRSPGTIGIVALAFWIVLGLAGLSFQYRNSNRKEESDRHKEQRSESPPAAF